MCYTRTHAQTAEPIVSKFCMSIEGHLAGNIGPFSCACVNWGQRERRRKGGGSVFGDRELEIERGCEVERLRVQIPAAPLFTRWAILCFLITFFPFQLKYTGRFSFQISNLGLRALSISVNISKVFSIFKRIFFTRLFPLKENYMLSFYVMAHYD